MSHSTRKNKQLHNKRCYTPPWSAWRI